MMPDSGPRLEEATDRLLESLDALGETVLSRRRTIQIGAGVAAGSFLATRLPVVRDLVGLGTAEATQAPSTVVLVYLDGGNDGLNTLVPLTDPKYQDFRGSLAIQGSSTLPINADYGLHASLPFMQSMWANGRAAFVRGVGYANNNLSHFTSIDHWHYGYGAVGSPVVASPHTGWVGRFADTIGPSNPFTSVAIGPQTPVSLRGTSVAALQIPIPQSQLFGANMTDPNEKWVADALRSINTVGTGTGTLGSGLSTRAVSAIDVAPTVSTSWTGTDGTPINRQLTMAANLINARLGVRVISVTIDGFDTHAQQLVTHSRLLSDLDAALSTFFARLDPALSRSVAVMTYSEFGRRARANSSAGTDHGSSSIAMVLGANVAGGIYGDEPGLSVLDDAGNTRVTTDFRRLYSTMLAGWLSADPDPILGATHVPLPLFAAQPGVVPSTTTTTTTSSTRPPAPAAGVSTSVAVTRAPAPDSPTNGGTPRQPPPAAGPGLTSTTVVGAIASPDGSPANTPSTTPLSTTLPTNTLPTNTLPSTITATSVAAASTTLGMTTIGGSTSANSTATQTMQSPSITPPPAPPAPVGPASAPPASGAPALVAPPMAGISTPSGAVIVPTELVVPGNGAVVAPSTTTPGSTELIPVGPTTAARASTSVSPTTIANMVATAPASTSASMRIGVRTQGRGIHVSIDHGPLRNDTWAGLYAETSPATPVAVRYLNNKPRPGIVARTSGSMTFDQLAPGSYVLRVFANGNAAPVAERRLRIR